MRRSAGLHAELLVEPAAGGDGSADCPRSGGRHCRDFDDRGADGEEDVDAVEQGHHLAMLQLVGVVNQREEGRGGEACGAALPVPASATVPNAGSKRTRCSTQQARRLP